MDNKYITFQRFSSYDLLAPVAEVLEENHIVYEIEENKLSYNPTSFDGNSPVDLHLKLRSEDFNKAEAILLESAKKSLENNKDHYLNDFTDAELMGILLKPDEWSRTDYQLSQVLLKSRGKDVNPDLIEALRKQRLMDLSRPEESHKGWILAGYISSFFGGLLGIFIGLHLWKSRKTLPNGTRIFSFNKNDRQQGSFMFLIGVLFFIFWLIVAFMSELDKVLK